MKADGRMSGLRLVPLLAALAPVAARAAPGGDEDAGPPVMAGVGVALLLESPPQLGMHVEPSLGWRIGAHYWHLRIGANLRSARDPLSDDQPVTATQTLEGRVGPARWQCQPTRCTGWSLDLGGQYLDWAGSRSHWLLADARGRALLGRPVGLELSAGLRTRLQVSSSVEERVSVGLVLAAAVVIGF